MPSIARQIEKYSDPTNIGTDIRPQNYLTKLDMDEVARALTVTDIQLVDYLAEW
ncbi:hypothetical protein D3C83_184610 [compost metagenome]